MQREDLLIEADELATIIDRPGLRLFDATVVFNPGDEGTGHERYLRRHIPGAAFLDHAAISDTDSSLMYTLPDDASLAEKLGALGISNDSEVVVYATDAICWATRVWWVLKYAGHDNVRVLNGGLSGWKGELSEGDEAYPATTFKASCSPRMFASLEEVEQAAASGGACVMNALTPEIYRGELDIAYKGHIPASINSSMFELTDRSQFLLDNDALAEKFADRDPDERLITYCGGGIAATTNACVALMLGFKDVAVFDGSMTEWLHNNKPVVTGPEPGTL